MSPNKQLMEMYGTEKCAGLNTTTRLALGAMAFEMQRRRQEEHDKQKEEADLMNEQFRQEELQRVREAMRPIPAGFEGTESIVHLASAIGADIAHMEKDAAISIVPGSILPRSFMQKELVARAVARPRSIHPSPMPGVPNGVHKSVHPPTINQVYFRPPKVPNIPMPESVPPSPIPSRSNAMVRAAPSHLISTRPVTPVPAAPPVEAKKGLGWTPHLWAGGLAAGGLYLGSKAIDSGTSILEGRDRGPVNYGQGGYRLPMNSNAYGQPTF